MLLPETMQVTLQGAWPITGPVNIQAKKVFLLACRLIGKLAKRNNLSFRESIAR
jgi:hypothetical protein